MFYSLGNKRVKSRERNDDHVFLAWRHSSLPFCPLDPVFFQKPLLAFAESVICQLHMWFPFLKSDFFSFLSLFRSWKSP